MVAPVEAFHWYVTEVPPVLLPFAGDKRVGAAGMAGEGVGVGACVGVGVDVGVVRTDLFTKL